MVERELPSSLKAIGTFEMPSSEIPKLLETVFMIAEKLFERIDQQVAEHRKPRSVNLLEHPSDLNKIRAANNLIFAVALNEGLLDDPDYLEMPGRVKKKIIKGAVQDTVERVLREPDMFADETQVIYTGIMNRLKIKSSFKRAPKP